jgi:endo-1,4-beta-D-glucanase Y
VQAAYEQWKADTITKDGAGGHLRVKRTPSDTTLEQGSTVSEGIAYGMLMAVYMNDQTTFDELWKYSQQWLGGCKLMDWYIDAAGTKRLGVGAATDADEDMAFALVMADRQWGGKGTLDQSYLQTAKDQISRIWNCEVLDGKLIKPGDKWGDWNTINISYFAPSYYRIFAKIDGNQSGWDAVIKTVYDTIEASLNATNGNQTNGLVPAWCTSTGEPNGKAYDNAPTNYQYDSCRTPFRIGLDWCWFGETRAKAYVAKTSSFFSKIGASEIVDGYDLDGTPHAANAGKLSAAFIGPAAVGALSSSSYQTFIDEAYTQVATLKLMAGGAYYEDAWTVLSLLAMTGNFVDFTAQ